MSWLKLENRTAVITGGASSIGKAIAESYASVGMNVVIADLNEDAGTALVGELPTESGNSHLFVKTNVCESGDVNNLIAKIVEAFGAVDVFVNNAGINIPRLLADPVGKEELTEDIFDKVTAINQKAVFLCGQAAAKQMQKQDSGVIINMSSESGSEGSQGQSAYAATKSALYALTRSWAKELGKQGIRVVGIAPGILEETGLRSDAYERALAYTRGISVDELNTAYASTSSIPLGRAGKLEEIADLATYLASDRASYIHGTTVNISGGKSRG